MIIGFGLNLADDIRGGVGAWFPIYLTNWALFFEVLYLIVAFLVSAWIFVASPHPSSEQPWPTKAAWLLRSIGQPGALVVTASYWTLVYTGNLSLVTFWIHAVNSIVVALDILTSCYEVRLLHYIYVLAFGTTYVVWTVVHYRLDIGAGPPPTRRFIYSALDWGSDHLTRVRHVPPTPSPHIPPPLFLFLPPLLSPRCVFSPWYHPFRRRAPRRCYSVSRRHPSPTPRRPPHWQSVGVSAAVLLVLTPLCVAALRLLTALRAALRAAAASRPKVAAASDPAHIGLSPI
jgi:hypothetical protein